MSEDRNYILRYKGACWRDGEKCLMFEPVVTPEMAERMRREAEMAKVQASEDVPAASASTGIRRRKVSAVPDDRGVQAKE